MTTSNGFVEDGYERARAALLAVVRNEVAAEYAERLAKASAIEWHELRLEMSREIERRLNRQAPPDALY